ncbi:hypothetical protein GOBAR_AA21330 [Gossypium barbadense]|uniref:Uncharacterized protein n=1 Tax=Gossypium barbadense TaxID=3634 RepID=A0A2P5X7N8_GOSBA|nr:hypothetical protein GOBAR_AA21330 [Gossypium barbadense]
MSSSRGKKATVPASKKRKGTPSSSGPTAEVAAEQVQLADVIRTLLTTDPWELFFGIIKPTYLELTMELCSTFHLQTVMTNYNDPGTVQFFLGGLVLQLSVPEFGTALCLYTEEFKEENDLHALNCHIHRSLSQCWDALVLGAATYNPSRTKASALPPSLCTAAQESSLTLIGQMCPQGISSMLSMKMIEKRRGTYPPQYCLAQSTEEEAHKDITDDVPPQHEDPLSQPPPPSRQFMQRLHMLTSLNASLDSSSSVFNDLKTLMLLYNRFVSTQHLIATPTLPTI